MTAPLVSVIVPLFNGTQFIKVALQSIYDQTYRPLEIIVVDDGSTDDSANLLIADERIRLIRQENQGPAAARNNGMLAAQGELVAFLDQDDVWLPEKMSRQVAVLRNDSSVEYVLCKQKYFLQPGVERPSWLKAEILDGPQGGQTPSTLLARRTLFDKIGPFDAALKITSDMDWFFRAKDAQVPMHYLQDVLVLHRIHSENQSNDGPTWRAELTGVIRDSMQRQKRHHDKA